MWLTAVLFLKCKNCLENDNADDSSKFILDLDIKKKEEKQCLTLHFKTVPHLSLSGMALQNPRTLLERAPSLDPQLPNKKEQRRIVRKGHKSSVHCEISKDNWDANC